MYDGAELGKAIAAGLAGPAPDLEGAIAKYEDAMFERSAAAALEAAKTHELCYGEEAPHGLIAFLSGAR